MIDLRHMNMCVKRGFSCFPSAIIFVANKIIGLTQPLGTVNHLHKNKKHDETSMVKIYWQVILKVMPVKVKTLVTNNSKK